MCSPLARAFAAHVDAAVVLTNAFERLADAFSRVSSVGEAALLDMETLPLLGDDRRPLHGSCE
jgi:gamma-glutamyl phosphate reductase